MADTALRVIVVTGPTATGKTQLAVSLAREFQGEIISADSRQVYRRLDLGTGKDLHEYGSGDQAVPVHLIDVVDPDEEYNLFRFHQDAWTALEAVQQRGRLPIIAGGSPLYLRALLDDYQLEGGQADPALRTALAPLSDDQLRDLLKKEHPDLYRKTDLTQRRRVLRAIEIARSPRRLDSPPRPTLHALILAPYYPRTETHRRIEARLDQRLANGMIEEVKTLREKGLTWERLEWLGLEYRWIAKYLQGTLAYEAMRTGLLVAIRRFCRSQDIWFRKFEREGHAIYWIPGGTIDAARSLVKRFLAQQPLPPPPFQLNNIRYGPKSTPPPGVTPQ